MYLENEKAETLSLLFEESEEVIRGREKYEKNFRQFCIDFGFMLSPPLSNYEFSSVVKYCEGNRKFSSDKGVSLKCI